MATRNTKGGYYTCTKNDTYVTCVVFVTHTNTTPFASTVSPFPLKSDRASRAGLVQPNSSSGGKKGSRNKNPWRVARSGKSKYQHTSTQAPVEFNPAIHHNDKPFVVCFPEEASKAKEC